MLFAFLVVLCYGATHLTGATTKTCEPSKYICAGRCPPLPANLKIPPGGVCLKDSRSDGCVCWLNNPSSQLNSLFKCEAKINGSISQVLCQTPSHCFPPGPEPGCLIIRMCTCELLNKGSPSSTLDEWQYLKALVLTAPKTVVQNSEENSVEKVQGDVREFSLKHLLFLLGFVIAPLLCWCLLNFFHEGKCRKKSPQPPEAQPIPTARGCTIDNMDSEDGEASATRTLHAASSPTLMQSSTIRSFRFPVLSPSAPSEDIEVAVCSGSQPQTPSKCESPPPYFESTDQSGNLDCGPPPSYEESIRGTDINVHQLWQTVFIVHPEAPRENA